MVDIPQVTPNLPVPVTVPVPVKAPQPAPVPVGFPGHSGSEPQAETPPPEARTVRHEAHRAPPEKAQASAPAQPVTYSRYGIHGPTGQFFVRVVEAGSNRVVKTVPPQWLLEIHARLAQMAGAHVDEEA